MRCRELQTKIVVHDPLTPDEARHAESCPDCAELVAFDADLDRQLAGWRDPGPMPARRRISPRAPRLVLAGAGLAAALTFAVVALPTRSPAQPARAAYRRMLAQTREVNSVHLVVRWRPGDGRVEDGPMRKKYELWWRPGAWREKWEGLRPSVKREESEGLMFYRYDPRAGVVQRMSESAPQPDFRRFDLAAFASEYMDTPKRFERPSPTTIITTNGGDWSRMVFTLDPATGLPAHAVKQSRDVHGTWTTAGEIDMDFDGGISDERFEPESLVEKSKP